MCTMLSEKVALAGSAKGPSGWFEVAQVYLGYDHPFHAAAEHAVSLDFVNEAEGPSQRVAIELTRQAARELAAHLLSTCDAADRYEAAEGAGAAVEAPRPAGRITEGA